jgi:hypothetical protein
MPLDRINPPRVVPFLKKAGSAEHVNAKLDDQYVAPLPE